MRAQRKVAAKEFLAARDTDGLLDWSRHTRGALDILYSLTHDVDERVIWRAIEASGKVAADIWRDRPDKIRDHLRRMLWLMSDESGGLGWYATEVIAEVLHEVPALVDEFGPLLPHYLAEEPFERGTHFALVRIGHLMPETVAGAREVLERSLRDPDPIIRFYALRALALVDSGSPSAAVMDLVQDTSEVRIYDFETGELSTRTVSEAATTFAGPEASSR